MRTPRPWILPTQPASRALLAAAGVSDDMIRTQLNAGRLRRLRRGVFIASDSWPDDPAGQHLVLAHAAQVTNPEAVISHASAAVHWGLPTPGFHPWSDSEPVLTNPSGTGRRARESGVSFRERRLDQADVTRDADGYPVTTLARTAADLAIGLSLPDALVVLDNACRQLVASMVSTPRTTTFADARLATASRDMLVAATVRPYTPLMDAIVKADPIRESPAESLVAGHLHLSGLPFPEQQAPIRAIGTTYYPDFLWRDVMLIVECDGDVKYNDKRDLVAEKVREDALRELGYRFLRIAARDIMLRPEWVIERIRRALER